MKQLLVYTAARLVLFVTSYAIVVGVYVLVAGTPVPPLWPLLLAAAISAVASLYLLRGMRERLATNVQERAQRAASSSPTKSPTA